MDRAEKLKDHLTKSESPCEADCELAEYSRKSKHCDIVLFAFH